MALVTAEGHAGQPASAAAAYDEHLSIGSGVQQRCSWRPVGDLPQHAYAGVIFLPAGHEAGEC
jgi:hypothetical protein